jgi:hypothetical protein
MFSTAFLDLPPLQGASGTVTLPGSKSISNRVLLLSALCQGTTVVHDLLDSDDTRVMLAALRHLPPTGRVILYLDAGPAEAWLTKYNPELAKLPAASLANTTVHLCRNFAVQQSFTTASGIGPALEKEITRPAK